MVDRNPGTRIPATGRQVEDAVGLPQRLVEGRLTRVMLPRSKHAVGDGARHDGVLEAALAEPREAPVRVGTVLLGEREAQLQDPVARERRERRIDGESRALRKGGLKPTGRGGPRG